MLRYTVASLTLALAAAPSPAQIPVSVASGVGGFGGGMRPNTPALNAPFGRQVVGNRFFPNQIGFGGGAVIAPFYNHNTSFFSGSWNPYWGNSYWGNPYWGGTWWNAPVAVPVGVPVPYPVPVGPPPPPPRPPVVLSNEFPATLILEFPAPATIWLDGKEKAGGPERETTITSPVLRAGQTYTFNVKGQWEWGGKRYEASRTITLSAGDRTRALIVSGNEVTEK